MNTPILVSPNTINAALETWFIQNIVFEGAPYFPGGYPNLLIDELAIYVELYEIDTSIIRRLKSLGKKVVLYHMGDELADKNIFAYSQCDLVIRNYYFTQIIKPLSNPKILWAPNGFRTGVGPRPAQTTKLGSHRRHLASFLGWLSNSNSYNNERKKFSDSAASCQPLLNLLGSTGFSNGYNVGLYSATMEDSIFTPCPAGNSPETIRLYDALECGCIPISLNHDFLRSPQALAAIGAPPFPILENWSDLPDFLKLQKDLLACDPEKINVLQKNCVNWWTDYKKYINSTIANELKNLRNKN
ncbi:exostosin family protein [Polynucleobacter sp. MWH-UH23A]|uniref:exostosin domain-containing protein n=1 Tax=Polynucleobacter sp. MWH-UH23A TaxID=1855613 RepID=UPI003364B8C6